MKHDLSEPMYRTLRRIVYMPGIRHQVALDVGEALRRRGLVHRETTYVSCIVRFSQKGHRKYKGRSYHEWWPTEKGRTLLARIKFTRKYP